MNRNEETGYCNNIKHKYIDLCAMLWQGRQDIAPTRIIRPSAAKAAGGLSNLRPAIAFGARGRRPTSCFRHQIKKTYLTARHFYMAGETGIEPATIGFGDRYSTS